MKRGIALLLALVLLLGLCACGKEAEPAAPTPNPAEEEMVVYKEYAVTAARVGRYAEDESFLGAVVWSGDDVARELTERTGKLQTIELDGACTMVALYTEYGRRLFVMDAENNILYKDVAGTLSFDYSHYILESTTRYNVDREEFWDVLEDYGYTSYGSAGVALERQARLELEYETFLAEKTTAAVLRKYSKQIEAIRAEGGDYTLNEQWLWLQAAEPVIARCGEYERRIECAKRYADFSEELFAREETEYDDYEYHILEFFEGESRLEEEADARILWAAKQIEAEGYAAKAKSACKRIAESLEQLKQTEGKAYRTTAEYFVLRHEAMGSGGADSPYCRYEKADWDAWILELKAELARANRTAATYYERDYAIESWDALIRCNEAFREKAIAYVDAEEALRSYREEHGTALETYSAAVEEICAGYTDQSYLNDMEYIKLGLIYEEELEGYYDCVDRRDAAKERLQSVLTAYDEEIARIEQKYEERAYSALKRAEKERMDEALLKLSAEFAELIVDLQDAPDVSFVPVGKQSGTTVLLAATETFRKTLEEKTTIYEPDYSSVGDSSDSHGSICAKAGCSNTVVSSGDSVYCSAHSNRCGGCGCYIDGDAMYCMDCIYGALYG